MTDSEQYVLDRIKLWVWSGFYSTAQIAEMIDDVAEEDCDIEGLKKAAGGRVRTQASSRAGLA